MGIILDHASRVVNLERLETQSLPNPSTLSMPTVLRGGPYRVYFFSHDVTEPPYVHVDQLSLLQQWSDFFDAKSR